ncbi:fibronectin type III domain-containing protein [Nonomuraea sp. NPDC049421]|uniref:fibronectin type III domain-containing protein n=1 Tax=Nonomuraea sp. NPDC049421 TaxID=3155275 RepID=UPI00342BE7D5
MDLRLVAYAPNADRLGMLPQPLSLEVAWPFNDVGSLRLAYPAHAVGAQLLEQPCEVAIEWSADGQTWTEPPDGRFLRILRRGDGSDRAGVLRYELPAYKWMFRKLVLYAGAGQLVDGKRPFLSATPGEILQTWLAEGQARGALPELTWTFTLTHDSAGAAWAKVLTIYYEPGLDLLTTLINLAEQGVIDFQVQGRELRVYNADTVLRNDLAGGDAPVDLRYGRDIIQAPEVGTLEDAASAVLVVGDNGFQQSYVSSAGHGPWGRWEMYVGQGGVSDPGTATLLADTAIKRAAGERVQRTRSIAVDTARWLPFRDYAPGDLVLAPGEAAAMQSLRVRQITLTRDHKKALTGHLVLNDRLLERDIRLARRTAGIVGGSTALGGSGARPAPETRPPRTPDEPAGLIVDSQAYIDTAGFARGQITATWGAVENDVAGVALDVSGYELYGRRNEVGLPWLLLAVTEDDDTTATYSPLPVGEEWAFKVRAVNNGRKGGFSAAVVQLIADDPDAPSAPSAPVLATRLGVVHVTWDGLGEGGEQMPADLARVRVWMQDPLAPGWEEIGYLDAAGSIVVPGLPYGADREFRFTAIDHSGNESPASASATIATAPLVEGDAAEGSITTGALAANAVTAAKVAAGAIEASHLAAAAVTADKLTAVLALASRIVAGDPAGARVELNEDGLEAYAAGGGQTVSVSAASGAVSIVGQLSTGLVGRRIIVNPSGSTDPEIRWYPAAGSNYARIFVDPDGAIIHISGANGDGTRRSQVIQRGDEWRAHIYDPGTGLASGGYMFAQPSQLEVGYNDPSPSLNRWRFTPTVAEYKGRLDYFGGDAGLLMFSVTINLNSGLSTIAWGSATMQSVPFCAIGLTYSGTGVVTSYMTARSTVGFNLRCDASGAAGSATAMIWAWRK